MPPLAAAESRCQILPPDALHTAVTQPIAAARRRRGATASRLSTGRPRPSVEIWQIQRPVDPANPSVIWLADLLILKLVTQFWKEKSRSASPWFFLLFYWTKSCDFYHLR